MYTVNVSIVGVAPLMQHRYPMPEFADMGKGGQKHTGAKDYTQEWRDYLYADKAGNVFQPSTHIEGAMVKASVSFKVTGKRGKSYKDLIQANVFVTPDQIQHHLTVPSELDTDADKPLYLDCRPVVVQRNRVVRIRPAFKPGWSLSFNLEVIDDEVPASILQDILTLAGKAVGIGDFRPRFGRFRVERFEVAK